MSVLLKMIKVRSVVVSVIMKIKCVWLIIIINIMLTWCILYYKWFHFELKACKMDFGTHAKILTT